MIMTALFFNSCSKNQISTTTMYSSQQTSLKGFAGSTDKMKETDKKNLLQTAHDAIQKGNNREGYIALQQFEDKFMTDESWENAERYDPRDFTSRKEILLTARKATDDAQFIKAYMLYRLLLPYL